MPSESHIKPDRRIVSQQPTKRVTSQTPPATAASAPQRPAPQRPAPKRANPESGTARHKASRPVSRPITFRLSWFTWIIVIALLTSCSSTPDELAFRRWMKRQTGKQPAATTDYTSFGCFSLASCPAEGWRCLGVFGFWIPLSKSSSFKNSSAEPIENTLIEENATESISSSTGVTNAMSTLCKHASPWMAMLLMAAGCAGEMEDIHQDTTATAPVEAVSESPAATEQRQTAVTESAPAESKVIPSVVEPSPKVRQLGDGSDIVLTRVLEQLAELRQTQLKTVQSDAESKK